MAVKFFMVKIVTVRNPVKVCLTGNLTGEYEKSYWGVTIDFDGGSKNSLVRYGRLGLWSL